MKTAYSYIICTLVCLAVSISNSFGAVGCTLNDPDRDIRRIFPEATGFKTEFITIKDKGGKELIDKIEIRLGDKLDSVFEAPGVPYAFYSVLKGKKLIGHVHGVNQKGKYGGMQLILATDLKGVVIDFYFQKISSPEAGKLRDKSFVNLFKGLSLLDFYNYKNSKKSKVTDISDPTTKSADDFNATIRGVMKNLILLDEFKLNEKYWKLFSKDKNI